MRMPETVKVGCHIYTILRRSRAQMPKENGARLDGCCDFDNLHIYLRKGLRISKAKEYLLHEILHACTYPALNGKTLEDEEFVDKTAPILLQVLQDNPELVAYLTQRLP